MKTKKINIKLVAVIIISFLSMLYTYPQDKVQKSAGGDHGEMDFAINWKRYYTYEEWTGIMKELQEQYPGLCDIESIGKSRMGREQLMLTITNKAAGSHSEKTAMWVDGAIHGNEVNGITCSLYLAWYMLTRYDYDPYVHELVNNHTFYILPGLNVDANDSYVKYPNTAHNPRETYRPEDNDGDGLYDEDLTEDVDGDGELSYMYREDPAGELRLSADGRRFVRAEDGFEGLRFERIGSEGYDNDGDGQINEDDIGGPDPNRNFPYGWNLNAGNPYPMSEPETRNVFEFQLDHPNIFASFHYHNTGRLIMFQAPPAERLSASQQESLREQTAERLEEMRKTNKYAQLYPRRVSEEYRHDMDVQTNIVTEGAYILKNYDPVIGGLSGQAHAATYYMLGAYSYLIELWGSPVDIADTDNDGRLSDEEYMKWIDLDLAGEGWIVPHKFDHPELGEIWIGGSAKKHMQRTPPSRYIEMEAEKNARFVLYCASQFPDVRIDDIKLKALTANIYQVDVTVENTGHYPTASDRSVQLERYVPDMLQFSGSDNITLVETSGEEPDEGRGRRSYYRRSDPGPETQLSAGEETEFRLKGKEKRIIRYFLALDGKKGTASFSLSSKTGGSDNKSISIVVE